MAETGGRTFDDITARLDEIVSAVKSKDTSLERTLDLLDEAIELGSKAVEMVDRVELSPREAGLLDAKEAAARAAAGEDADAVPVDGPQDPPAGE